MAHWIPSLWLGWTSVLHQSISDDSGCNTEYADNPGDIDEYVTKVYWNWDVRELFN